MKNAKTGFFFSGVGLLAFVGWTVVVGTVDRRPIGPDGSVVGLATLNGWFRDLIGVNWGLYTLTDWLGLVPLGVAAVFAVLGLTQLLKRRSLAAVDRDLLLLGGLYLAVFALYLAFERWPLNFRPVWIEGVLEASYPSSTTLLALCILPTAIYQVRLRLRGALAWTLWIALGALTVFMVVARLLSGVHWLTDILGGALFAAASVGLYRTAVSRR